MAPRRKAPLGPPPCVALLSRPAACRAVAQMGPISVRRLTLPCALRNAAVALASPKRTEPYVPRFPLLNGASRDGRTKPRDRRPHPKFEFELPVKPSKPLSLARQGAHTSPLASLMKAVVLSSRTGPAPNELRRRSKASAEVSRPKRASQPRLSSVTAGFVICNAELTLPK